MSDNFVTDAGAGGNTYASDDIGGVHYPILKIAHGALDSATLVSTSSGLPVQMQGTWNITNAGTFAVQVDGAALTSLQLLDDTIIADDAAFTPATTKVAMAGFTFDDVAPDSVNEGDAGAARMSANRNIYVNIRDNAGNERGLNVDANGFIGVTDGAGSLTVDNTALSVTGGGVEATALRVTVASDSTGVLSVDDNGSSLTVDNGGTFAVQVDGAALTALQLIDNIVVVEDAAASGGESGVQALVIRKDTGGTLASADGDFTPLQVDASGALRVTGGGGGTEYTEDAAAAADPVGTSLILVRKDTPAALTSADGDNVAMRGTDYGAAYVTLLDTSGTPVSVGGGTQYTEDAAAAANPIGNVVNLIRDDALARTVTADGDNVAQGGSAAGAAYVEIVGGTTKLGDSTNGLLVNLGANNDVTVTGNITTVSTVSALGNSTTGPQKAEDVASANADVGIPAMAVQKATPANTAGTDGDYEFLQMSAGRLWTSATVDAALPAGTNAIGKLAANSGVDIGDVDVTSIIPGSGATNLGKAEDAAHASGDIGVMALAIRDDTLGATSGTEGDYEPLHTNADGAVWSALAPSATGGLTTFMASGSDGSSILVATAQAVKASAGVLYGYYVYNPEAAVTFVHFYNTAAASVTVGTTNPLFTLAVPAASAANVSIPQGVAFSNAGWSVSATTTAGGNTAPATGASLVVWYK